MTTYIIWPKTIDDDFRQDYYATTGEKIQQTPSENSTEDKYLAGSSRLKDGQILNLSITYPEAEFYSELPPYWEPKTDEAPEA